MKSNVLNEDKDKGRHKLVNLVNGRNSLSGSHSFMREDNYYACYMLYRHLADLLNN